MDLFFSINDLVIASYTRAIKGKYTYLFFYSKKKVKRYKIFSKKFELDKKRVFFNWINDKLDHVLES